ncbi:LisH domain-containing protein, putative [Plasmodium vivax]|nr:LisH domain-containing protein, putative [Plasmodium vivax]
MKILLSSDEVNLIVYRYLVENGFIHAAYAFFNEANISKNSYYISHDEKLPCHALVTFMQKALIFIFIEYHTECNNARISCKEPFSLFRRHECCTEEKDLSEEQENKTEIRENEKNTSNNLNKCTSSSKSFGNNNIIKSYMPNSVSFSDLNNEASINNVNDHGPSGANAKKNSVIKKGGGKADSEEANGKANQDSNKTVNQDSNGNGNDANNNGDSNTNDSNASKAKTNSKPSIYRSSFSNFASLNYNDSNISFKDIKRNYANIFAQGKKSKKSSSNKKNNNSNSNSGGSSSVNNGGSSGVNNGGSGGVNNGGSNNVNNSSSNNSSNNSNNNNSNSNNNSEAANSHNEAGESSKKNGTIVSSSNNSSGNSSGNNNVSSSNAEGKESSVKDEPDDASTSGNQRKKPKIMKIVSKPSKANEDQNGKWNNISDSIPSEDKKKENNHVPDVKEDNVEPTKNNAAKKENNLNNNVKKNNANTSSGKGTSLSNNNNHSNGKKKELSGGDAGQNSSSSNKKKKKIKNNNKEITYSNSTSSSKKTIKNSLKKEKKEKGSKSATSKQKKNNKQEGGNHDDEDDEEEMSDENSEQDSEFSNDNQECNKENACNVPLEDSTNNSAKTRDNPSGSSINNNATVDDKTDGGTYVNLKKSSSTNDISNSSSQNSTIDGVKNEMNNSHITHYDGCPNNACDGILPEEALASEKPLNGNNSNEVAMLKEECKPPEGEAKEGNNSNKNEFNFSFANFLNKKISSIFNNSGGGDGINGDSHNKDSNNESCKGNNSNDSAVKDGSSNEQVFPQDAQDPPASEPYESVSSSKDRYNKFSQKSKLIKDEFMEAKYEKEHLAREQTSEAEEAAGAPARKQKRPYDYSSGMKVQGGGDSHQMEEHENGKICVEEKKRKKSSIYEENYKNEMNKEFFKKLTQISPNKGDNKCKANGSVDMKEEKEDELRRGVAQQGVEAELGGAESGDPNHLGDDKNAELDKAKKGEYNKMSFNKSGKNYYNGSPSTANGDDHEEYDKMDKNPPGEVNFIKTNEKKNSMEVHTAREVDEERSKS